MTKHSPFRYFKTSPEIIRLAVMMYVRYPLSLRNVEDLLHERGIEISHETVRFWWNRFGPMFAAEIRSKYVQKYGIPINQCVTAQRTFDARPVPSAIYQPICASWQAVAEKPISE
jgi:transposase-like protein